MKKRHNKSTQTSFEPLVVFWSDSESFWPVYKSLLSQCKFWFDKIKFIECLIKTFKFIDFTKTKFKFIDVAKVEFKFINNSWADSNSKFKFNPTLPETSWRSQFPVNIALAARTTQLFSKCCSDGEPLATLSLIWPAPDLNLTQWHR